MAGGKIVGRSLRFLLGGVVFVAIGWIGAPAGMAALNTALADDPAQVRLQTAQRLVTAMSPAARAPAPQSPGQTGVTTLSRQQAELQNSQVRACGYDPQALLGNEQLPFRLSAEWGVEVLAMRARHDNRRVLGEENAHFLAEHHAPATLAALTQCIATTPAARLCRRVTRHLIAGRDASAVKAQAETTQFLKEQDQAILCTFLDGAAARRGVAKLAPTAKGAVPAPVVTTPDPAPSPHASASAAAPTPDPAPSPLVSPAIAELTMTPVN